MPQPGVYGSKAERLARLAVLERTEKDLETRRETNAPPLMRLALAALGGMFLLLAYKGAIWAWVGAAAFMLSICGASPPMGLACGAIAASIAGFRLCPSYDATGLFWLLLCLQIGGGALAGVLAALISKRLPAEAFPLLAALLPAGLEHLGSLSAFGNLLSTALTQYRHPAVVCIGRLGGMALVTFVIFLFGAAAAAGVRFIQSPRKAGMCAAPGLALVLLMLIYGAIGDARSGNVLQVLAININSLNADRQSLAQKEQFDAAGWAEYTKKVLGLASRHSGKQVITTAIERTEVSKQVQLVVWPEAAVVLDADGAPAFLKIIEGNAKSTQCAQALGFYNSTTMESCAAITDDQSAPVVTYARRRFVPGADDVFVKGHIAVSGPQPPAAVQTPFGRAGVILSLDANLFDNFAALAKDDGALACVCGLDDVLVPQTSIRLLVFNAALSGMAVVRSAVRGQLAVIDPNGAIIAHDSSADRSDKQIQAAVPLGEGGTIFLLLGNFFAWLALFGGLGAGIYASSRPSPPGKPAAERPAGGLSYKTREGVKNV